MGCALSDGGIVRVELLGLSLACCVLSACGGPDYNAMALRVGGAPAEGANVRAFETRRYNDASDSALMAAIAATMQDMGFSVTETSSEIGVVAAQKTRNAREVGEIAGAVAEGVLEQLLIGTHQQIVYNKSQVIHVTVVASPAGTAHDVRVTFDRYLIDNNENLRATDIVTDPKIYAEFFTHLDSAVNQGRRS